jgi:hypothetical protein
MYSFDRTGLLADIQSFGKHETVAKRIREIRNHIKKHHGVIAT